MNTLSVIQVAVVGYDKNFSYVVFDAEAGEAMVADPSGDIERVFAEVDKRGLRLVGIVITHTHPDHIEKLEEALAYTNVPVYIHENGVSSITADNVRTVDDGDEIALGGGKIKALYTPGHTDNSICYYISSEEADDKVPKVITGDTLFVSRCGKTTPENAPTLYESLQRLKALPPETVIYSGHDYGNTPSATMAHEKANNKYLTAPDYETFYERRFGT